MTMKIGFFQQLMCNETLISHDAGDVVIILMNVRTISVKSYMSLTTNSIYPRTDRKILSIVPEQRTRVQDECATFSPH